MVFVELEPSEEERLRAALATLAARTPAPGRSDGRGAPRGVWAAAAAIVLAGTAGVTVAVTRDYTHRAARAPLGVPSSQPGESSRHAPPPLTTGSGIAYDLARLVGESERIVVGTVTGVAHGPASDQSGGLAYLIATVHIDQTLKGPEALTLAAFDYDYSGGTSVSSTGGAITSGTALSGPTSGGGPLGATFIVGQQVLLFLSSSTGTVHEHIAPQHWQVTGGAQGEYVMRDGKPDAPFSLDDVRNQVR